MHGNDLSECFTLHLNLKEEKSKLKESNLNDIGNATLKHSMAQTCREKALCNEDVTLQSDFIQIDPTAFNGVDVLIVQKVDPKLDTLFCSELFRGEKQMLINYSNSITIPSFSFNPYVSMKNFAVINVHTNFSNQHQSNIFNKQVNEVSPERDEPIKLEVVIPLKRLLENQTQTLSYNETTGEDGIFFMKGELPLSMGH